MVQRKTYSPEEIAKIFDHPVKDIIKLCEDQKMHSKQIDGKWRIDESVLSSASSDFKSLPIWYQNGIVKFENERK